MTTDFAYLFERSHCQQSEQLSSPMDDCTSFLLHRLHFLEARIGFTIGSLVLWLAISRRFDTRFGTDLLETKTWFFFKFFLRPKLTLFYVSRYL